MPEHIRGKIKPMECLFERACRSMGFVLMRDGSKTPQDIQWLEKPTFFSRVYRLRLDDIWVNTWIRFTYDTRNGYADFNISHKDLATMNDAMEKIESREEENATAFELGEEKMKVKEKVQDVR